VELKAEAEAEPKVEAKVEPKVEFKDEIGGGTYKISKLLIRKLFLYNS
jgi:hypothetical protein